MKAYIIFNIFIIGVWGNAGVYQMNKCSHPDYHGSSMMQIVTPTHSYRSEGLFWNGDGSWLSYVDRYNATYYRYSQFGVVKDKYLSEIATKELVFIIPHKNLKNKFLVGYNCEVSQVTNENGEFTWSPPIKITSDAGYTITKAHADRNGKLFLTLNSVADKKHRGGRLYKYVNNSPYLVKQFSYDVGDFVWSHDYKNMYLICGMGKRICKYTYSEDEADISNEKVVFETHFKGSQDTIQGIEIDNSNVLWVAVKQVGRLMTIDPDKGVFLQALDLPVSMLTGLTFGGKMNNGLFISTSKECHERQYEGGSILYLSGINGTGEPDNGVLYT